MIANLTSLGIIHNEKIPEEYLNIGDKVNSPDDQSEERKSSETKVWLIIDDIENHYEGIHIFTATQVFCEYVHMASYFTSICEKSSLKRAKHTTSVSSGLILSASICMYTNLFAQCDDS